MSKLCTIQLGAVLAVVVGLSCDTFPPSDPFEASEVAGRYVATFGVPGTYIELQSDSTYVHVFNSDDGHKYVDSGSWKITEGTPGYFRIHLDGFIVRYPRDALGDYDPSGQVDSSGKGPDSFTFKKRQDTLQIVVRPYENERFVRQSPSPAID